MSWRPSNWVNPYTGIEFADYQVSLWEAGADAMLEARDAYLTEQFYEWADGVIRDVASICDPDIRGAYFKGKTQALKSAKIELGRIIKGGK